MRRKYDSYTQFRQIANQVKQTLSDFYVQLIINYHLDIACEVDASGIHIGQNDLSVLEARQYLPEPKIIGITVETWSNPHPKNTQCLLKSNLKPC